jgi:dCTP deaminase
MSILVDRQIKCLSLCNGMITPFVEKMQGNKTGQLSWGLTSVGYDVRLGTGFKRYVGNKPVDPKNIQPNQLRDTVHEGPFLIEPGEFILGHTIERFNVPRDIAFFLHSKSTYARCGILVSHDTVGEPEWDGVLTLEIANVNALPVMLYPGEGICQLVFHRGSEPCMVSYADRTGKYQSQTGVQPPKV